MHAVKRLVLRLFCITQTPLLLGYKMLASAKGRRGLESVQKDWKIVLERIELGHHSATSATLGKMPRGFQQLGSAPPPPPDH